VGDKKQYGITIHNSQRYGFQYYDSTGNEYDFRYYKTTITNDTSVRVRVELGSTERLSEWKVFIIPNHLTANGQSFDPATNPDMKKILDEELEIPTVHVTTLDPSEKSERTIGVLSKSKYFSPTTPFDTKLYLTKKGNLKRRFFKLKLNDKLIIPFGAIGYLKSN
jgi:hypothetical protein